MARMETTGPVNQPGDRSMQRDKKRKVSELMKCKCYVTAGKQKREGDVTAHICMRYGK